LEHGQQVARKATCERKSNVAHRKKSLTMIGLGFFDNDCNDYNPYSNINNDLRGIGKI